MAASYSSSGVGRFVIHVARPQNLAHYFRRHLHFQIHAYDATSEEPDWEREMSLFKQRQNKPSHLEALRKMEAEKVDVGRVLFCQNNIAIVNGLNNDAEIGTALSFASGAVGTLLWRRSDNLVFALVLGGADLVSVGDGVECRVSGILQVVDEAEGPTTKREYVLTTVPAGDALRGRVVDYLGRPLVVSVEGDIALEDAQPIGANVKVPMLNVQPDMESREQIAEALVTGVKALDILTPLGRGQALLVTGPQSGGKTQLCLDAVVGQRGSGVRCVYAAVGCSGGQLARTLLQLRAAGCMRYTTVVAAPADRSLGEQYAAMLTACSIAEATRDAGGHALVVLNDVGAMVRMWEHITAAMADLGVARAAVEGEMAELEQQAEVLMAEMSQGAAEDSSGSSGDDMPLAMQDSELESSSGTVEEDEGELVEYEGMLVSLAAAQRRRFFSSLIQRTAKMHRRLKGGSLTSLLVVPGVPASGAVRAARKKAATYRHLSQEQKAKLLAAIESTERAETGGRQPGPNELRTEVVEEFMSIADGQIVIRGRRDGPTGGVAVDPQLSVSRIGSRALEPAVADLATQVRFDLAQAEDARRFAISGTNDAAAAKALRRAAVVAAALPQRPRTVCSLEDQAVQLLALSKGLLDEVEPEEVAAELQRLTAAVRRACPLAVAEIAQTKRLTAESEAAIVQALTSAAPAAVLDTR